jgi:hypothetical protein
VFTVSNLSVMPKNKSKQQRAKAATDGNDNDDFEEMLAEVTAADSQLSADTRTQIADTIGKSSSSSSSAHTQVVTVSDEAILDACKPSNISQFRRWGRQGVRVSSAMPLVQFVIDGLSCDILRCLVKDLGTDVNRATFEDGSTALSITAQLGNLAVMNFLLEELVADVNQAKHNGATPLIIADRNSNLAVVRCLVKEFGADVSQSANDGTTPLYIASAIGHLDVVRYLVKDLGVDVVQRVDNRSTPLHVAAQEGNFAVVRCMVKELGADVNKVMHDGATPLMIAARYEHENVVAFLIKYGANTQNSLQAVGTAADISRKYAASAKQTEYQEARTHCVNPGCDGVGVKKCAGCLKVYYCTRECQLAHRSAHKAECRRSAGVAADEVNKPTATAM